MEAVAVTSIFENPNFQPLDRVAGKPTISITKNGVGFSKQALSRLEYAHYVQMFINKVDKQLGIRKCDKDASGAMKFVPEKKNELIRLDGATRHLLRISSVWFRKNWQQVISFVKEIISIAKSRPRFCLISQKHAF